MRLFLLLLATISLDGRLAIAEPFLTSRTETVCSHNLPSCPDDKKIEIVQLRSAYECSRSLNGVSNALLYGLRNKKSPDGGPASPDKESIYVAFQQLYRAYGLDSYLESFNTLASEHHWEKPLSTTQAMYVERSNLCVEIYNDWYKSGLISLEEQKEAMSKAEADIRQATGL